MLSVIQNKKACYFCQKTAELESHHILFGSANRKKSEKYGLKVWLCHEHHTGNYSVHQCRDLDLMLKRKAQQYFEEIYGSREDFRHEFGKSFL